MKSIIALFTLGTLIAPQAALATIRGHRPIIGTQQTTCWADEYTETYVPGTRNNPGYVRIDVERIEYPCRRGLDTTNVRPYNPNTPDYVPTGRVDDNSCVEGAVIGGALAAGALAAGTRGPDQIWAIPLGVIGGSLIGCQVDGG